MVSWGIGDGGQVEREREVDRITQGRGSFEESQTILEPIGVAYGRLVAAECANGCDVERVPYMVVAQEFQEGGWARNDGGADRHGVRHVEEAALKTAIFLKRPMELRAPLGVREIPIDPESVRFRQRPADPMALNDAA